MKTLYSSTYLTLQYPLVIEQQCLQGYDRPGRRTRATGRKHAELGASMRRYKGLDGCFRTAIDQGKGMRDGPEISHVRLLQKTTKRRVRWGKRS
ncbi:hypothetical protein BDZ97DRAFT_195433 [Flammula alnicola]|nr:hypothetical protein BDZ97DRAFT_195433 [Flammula alnicola]